MKSVALLPFSAHITRAFRFVEAARPEMLPLDKDRSIAYVVLIQEMGFYRPLEGPTVELTGSSGFRRTMKSTPGLLLWPRLVLRGPR